MKENLPKKPYQAPKVSSEEPDDLLVFAKEDTRLGRILQSSESLSKKTDRVKKISQIVVKKANTLAQKKINFVRRKMIPPYYKELSPIGQMIQNVLPRTPFQEFLPPKSVPIRKVLAAYPGFGGHSSWLLSLQELTEYGIAVYIRDMRGFGKNNSSHSKKIRTPKGHVRTYKTWLREIKKFSFTLRKYYPDQEHVRLGNSLGGLLLFLASTLYKNLGDKFILMVPGFAAAGGIHVSLAGKKILYLPGWRKEYGSYNFPYIFKVSSKMGLSYLHGTRQYMDLQANFSHTPEEAEFVEKSSKNPDFHVQLDVSAVTPWLMWQACLATRRAYLNADKAKGPILVVTSGPHKNSPDDGIVCCETIRDMFEKFPATEKQLVHKNGPHDLLYFHDLYAPQEPGNTIIDILYNWIDKESY